MYSGGFVYRERPYLVVRISGLFLMSQSHQYQLGVQWAGNTGEGIAITALTKKSHHMWENNKPKLKSSSDPAFRGTASTYNPEKFRQKTDVAGAPAR